MRIRSTFSTFAVAAVAGSLLLSACGDSEMDAAPSPDPDLSSSALEPADAESDSDEAPEEEDDGLPPQPSPTREPISAGSLDGDEMNAAGVAWFSEFCSGIGALEEVGVPDTQDLDVTEIVEAVSSTYEQFGTGFDAAAEGLVGLDSNMNFENAEAFAAEAVNSLEEVSAIYTSGAEAIKAGTYATQEDLIADVRTVETGAVEAGAGNYGLSNLDESVFNAITIQVPACAN